MNKQRLLRVAEVLEGVPDERFGLKTWRRKAECGTVCCAVGHYVEQTPSAGLRFRNMDSPLGDGIVGDDAFGWDAVASHFRISTSDARYVFSDSSYKGSATRADVIARIRDFVAEDGSGRSATGDGE